MGAARERDLSPRKRVLVVTDLLVANFLYIFDPQHTSVLKRSSTTSTDAAKRLGTTPPGGFHGHFGEEGGGELAQATHENIKRMEKPTDEKCDLCGSPLVLKWGKLVPACSAYDKKNPNSCAPLPRRTSPPSPRLRKKRRRAAQEAEQSEEFCENCGRVMVLKRGRFGMFMACPGYNEDPPCKTTRKLNQKQQQKAAQPLPMHYRELTLPENISCGSP